MPRRNCKHIDQVIDEKPAPLNRENWDKLNGKKKQLKAVLDKFCEIQQNENREGE
jgi:hypothetical protein